MSQNGEKVVSYHDLQVYQASVPFVLPPNVTVKRVDFGQDTSILEVPIEADTPEEP
ncbi:MAG TPA: hypothetical protein VMT67_12675 [Terriglobales bacterium]|nr:hypothetical protein [Terriglobales bacterium]